MRASMQARVALKLISLGSGILMVTAGVLGCSTLVLGGGMVYFIGSLYAIIFGLGVLCVEIKDKVPLVSAIYDLIDTYLKFLTLQTGKGLFYFGIGLLVFFMGPVPSEKCVQQLATNGTETMICSTPNYVFNWGVTNVAALVLSIVGVLHTFKVVAEVDRSVRNVAHQQTVVQQPGVLTTVPLEAAFQPKPVVQPPEAGLGFGTAGAQNTNPFFASPQGAGR